MSNVSKEIAIELVEDGQAGNGIVSVTRTYGISASGTTASDTTSPSDITTWSAGSPTVTTAKPYLWVKEITVYTETPDTTKYYCVGKRGDNGVDAKDVEWAYIRTTTPTAPTILNDNTYTDSNGKTYTADGHLPRVDSTNRTDIEKENSGSSSKYYECTDDPKGVNDTWKYEWEIKRTKGNVGSDGSTRTWNYYTGDMTLHNNYAESAYIIDIDNDNDQFGTDSDSKVLVEQTRSTTVTLYDGATPQTLKSLTVALKYENGTTNVPIDVATYTADKDTGKVDVTVKVNNTPNSHTEIQAHITATDTNDRQKTIVFALYKVMGGAPGLTPIIYNVAATDKVFSFQRTDANALTPSSRTSQINVARTEGNTTTILDQPQSGLTFSWGFDDESTAQASAQAIGDSIEITSTDATSHSSVWVELSTGDRETLAIVKDGAKGNSGTSVEAQYAPNSSPTSSQIHTTFQNGDKYMRTRSGSGSWSGWQKIVGENGAETDFTFNISKNKTSTSASTAPANCYYSEWQDAPIAVTTTYPYLWAKVVQKDGDGTIQSTSYIRLTGEDGKSVLAQYSVDGSSNWHTTFATGDEWMRTSDNGGTSWSAAMKIVGEDGDSTNFEFGISQYKTANGAPSDISTWSDAPIATTSSKPYLWSKVTTPDGTVSYIRLTGEKGASITKSSEVNTYKVSDSGTTTPTGTWYSTKAAANNAYAWSANRYMWTKTVITWSDTSTTTLYSAERNPDDGDAGMSIVIASQSVTYSKQTSGNLDPTTLTYGSYPSSLSKGDWLYSKTTVNYETSEGASAGSTSTYSVSYIGTDGVGQAGRGITGVYEHYKASANSTGETTPTSTDWGTTPTPSDWGKNKPYLWNYERITYSSGTTVERTTASVVAVWTEDGAGIDSITNYYLATSASSGVTTSTSGWTTSVQTMDETNCYLWNYERISYTQGKSSTTTTPHIIGHYGRDGEVITKVNETYRYATNNTGTTPDASSSSWQTTKPTLQKGYWLYTETTIHWSNNTETVLYTSERNPNDGAAGQSIIVDGSTVMKYYVGSSNTTHPAENSSDWKDLDQVTQTQGMWLWSKSTTYYRKANSTSGSHDAGSSVQYNVSYIAEDGDTPEAARGVESVTEYYKATNSSSPMSKPTSDSGWDTDPNLSNLTNKWGETYKYLWNYEKVTYNKAPLVERTIPQILAIWTKDGNAGKGIDSITNYYLINNSSTAPSRPSTDGTGGWSTTPTPPNSSNPYLWNYEKIVWLSPSSTTYTDVQMIGHYGKDGTSPYVADLDNEMDGVPCTYGGVTTASYDKYINVSLWYGSSPETLTKLTTSTAPTNVTLTPDMTNKRIRVQVSSGKQLAVRSDITITVASANSGDKTLHFILNGVRGGIDGTPATIYDIVPSLNEVSVGRGTDNSYTPRYNTLQCGYKRSVGSDISTVIETTGNIDSTYRLFFRRHKRATASVAAAWETTYYYYNYSTYKRYLVVTSGYSTSGLDVATYDAVEFLIYKNTSNNSIAVDTVEDASNKDKIADKETVSVISDGVDGTSPIVVDLTNENDAMVYDEFGVLKSGNVTSEAKLYVGSQDKSSEATWTITPTNCTLSSGNSRNIVVAGMSALTATVTASASYGNGNYTAILSLKKLINEDKYELDVTPVSIGYNSTTNSPSSQVISVSIWKVSHVDGSRTRSNPPSGYAVRLYKDGSDTSHAYSGSYSDWVNNPWTYTLTPLSSWSSCLVKLNNGTNNSTSAWLDYETIPIAKTANGANGTSPYIADLDNEMDSVACDKNGKVKASTTCGTNVSLFYGSSKRSYKITGITKNGTSTMGTGVTVKIDDSTPSYPTSASKTHTVSVTYATTATISSKDDFAITIQDATDTSITRVLHFTINGVREGANGEPAIIFRLNPSASEVVKKKDGTYIPAKTSKVTCAVLKTTGSETSEEPIDETDDYVAKYKLNGTGSEVAFPTNGITVSDITSKLEIFLYNADSSILLDKETIPLVEDGTDGTSPYLADLDNEMGGVVCDSDGYTTSEQYIETNAQLFRGTTAQTLKSSGGVVCSIAGYPLSSNYTSDPSPSSTYKAVISGLGTTSANIKVYAKANLLVENVDIKVTLTDTNDVSRDAILTMNGVRGGENGDPAVLFNLLPSVSAIKKDANNVLTPTSLTCDVRKITGNSTPTRATSSDGTLRYRVDGDITSTSDGTALTINTGTVNSYTATSKFITFAFFKGTTLVDKERVPIVYDGAKGDAGKGYKTIVYRDTFTEAQWAIYGAIDHTETWDGTSSARNGCGVGDWFLVVGTATDSKDYHTATYECDNSSSNLHGKCINHQVTKNAGQMQTNIIRESHFNTLSYWITKVGQVVDNAIGDHKGFRMENNTSSSASISCLSQYMINSSRQWLSPSTIYTLSWWVKSAVSTYSYIYEYAVDTSYLPYVDGVRVTSVDGNYGRYGRHDWAATGNDWVYHTFTFKTNSSFSGNVLVLWGLLNAASGSTATICMPKLELGDKASGYMVSGEEMGESYRILYTWNNTTKIEVKDLPCNADYSGSFSGNFYFYLQRLVDGTWTDCPNYYWAIKGFNSSGGINYGYNGSTAQAANSISSTTVNDSTNRYFEVYFLTEAMTPAGSSKAAVTETTTRKIFMSSRISKVPAGDGGLSIAITPSTLVVNTDENVVTEAASQDFTFKVYKGEDEVPVAEYAVTHSSLPNSDWTWTGLYYNAFRIQCASEATFETPTAITVTVALSSGGSIQTSVLLVPNRKGADGSSPYRIDLTNDMDAIQYADDVMAGSSVATTAKLYCGTQELELTTDYTLSYSPTGCTASRSGQVITVSALSAERGYVVITATLVSDNTKTFSAVFTVMRLQNKDKFYIQTDKQVIPINTDTTSSSTTFPINIKVYRDGINPQSKKVETSLVQTLSNYGLYLWAGAESPRSYVTTYSSGYTYNMSFFETNVHIYITDNATFGSGTILDHEVIPSVRVQNGQQGIQGKMGRTPYYWGKWSEKASTDTFTVSDYMTPYVANGETGGIPQCWIFVGANGSYTKSTAGDPSNTNQNWQLMTSDFEYLITKAIFSDFAKLGSGIFNGDFMFSQYGTYDGNPNSNEYNRFTPEVFNKPIVVTSSNTTIQTSEVQLKTNIRLVNGAFYRVNVTFESVSANSTFYLRFYRSGVSTAAINWSGSITTTTKTFSRATINTDGSGYWGATADNYIAKAVVSTGNAVISSVVIEHIDFNPNLSIDWLNGIIRANTGWFKNVTVEGVMNNLIQEITSTNYTNYGVYTSGTNTDAFWLNTAKVGSIIRYKYTKPLGLPSAYANAGEPVETYLCDSGDGTHQMTLNELRQCIGKKIYVLTDGNTGMARIRVGKYFSSSSEEKMLLYNDTWYYAFSSNTTTANWFWVFECKMGERNGRECIYWELLASHNKLPDNLAF